MHQMNVVVFESELDEVARTIARLRVLHLIKLDEEMPWTRKLQGVDADREGARIQRLRERLSLLMKELRIREVPAGGAEVESFKEPTARDLNEIEEKAASLEGELDKLKERRKELEQRLNQLRGIMSESAPLSRVGIMSPDASYRFLLVRYGRVLHKNIRYIEEKLAPLAAVAITLDRRDDEDIILVIGLKRDKLKLKRILREAAFEDIDIPSESDLKTSREMLGPGLEDKIAEIEKDIEGINSDIDALRDESAPAVTRYYQLLRVAELYIKVKGYLKKTKRTYLFSGWVPSDRKRRVKNEILKAAGGRAIIEIVPPEEIAGVKEGKIKVPVLFKHPKFLRPFGMLVSSYGVPNYKVIDPTIIVAITFLLMFGMMFGDIGHGLILAVIGWMIGFRKKKDGKRKETTVLVGRLAFYCGVSSIIFGILFGSVFGVEYLFEGLWKKPMDNVLYFFKVAIYFGVAMISGGIILNAINAIRTKNFRALFFDHAGIVSAVMYWCGIGVVAAFLANEPVPIKLLVLGLGVPLLLIFLREPITAAFEKRKIDFKGGFFNYFMETIIEIMEIVTGYLGNTISFIRVAAFSMAHVGLFIAVFSLVEMVKGGASGIFYSALVLILGNAVIVALEGLVVTIQAIRLEYYEFFSKFFVGGGVAYEPIGMDEVSNR